MAQAAETRKETIFTGAFSTFSVDDIKAAKEFYSETLGLDVAKEEEGLGINFDDNKVFLYPKDDHEPATFTVFNLQVANIDEAVDELSSRGIEFESYGGDIETDEKGIFRGGDTGPNIAWFKDPAGNILSVIERQKHDR